jgi:hypothetical protein
VSASSRNPTISLEDDVAVTRRVLATQEGSAILVLSQNESRCAYNCLKYGWLHHSRDGRYVFVGESGDVIDTTLRKTAMTLPALANSRKEIEIDFEDGSPLPTWAMNNRSTIGGRAPMVRNPVSIARSSHFGSRKLRFD